MRFTALLTAETDSDAYIPVLGVVTRAATVEAALEAAQAAAYLDIMGRLDDGEKVPVEPDSTIVARIAVEAPAPTGVV